MKCSCDVARKKAATSWRPSCGCDNLNLSVSTAQRPCPLRRLFPPVYEEEDLLTLAPRIGLGPFRLPQAPPTQHNAGGETLEMIGNKLTASNERASHTDLQRTCPIAFLDFAPSHGATPSDCNDEQTLTKTPFEPHRSLVCVWWKDFFVEKKKASCQRSINWDCTPVCFF